MKKESKWEKLIHSSPNEILEQIDSNTLQKEYLGKIIRYKAKLLKKEKGIPYTHALQEVSKTYGFTNWAQVSALLIDEVSI